MTKYRLVEVNNMQVPHFMDNICLTPRIEYEKDGTYYRSINDKEALVTYIDGETIRVDTTGHLVDGKQNGNIGFRTNYLFSADEVRIKGQTEIDDAIYYLPIISKNTDPIKFLNEKCVQIIMDSAIVEIESSLPLSIKGNSSNRIFNPVGGFEAIPFSVVMKKNEWADFSIKIK
jgi:hypothetical protein